MKVNYTNGKMSVSFDAANQKDLFEQVAAFQEVFEETRCGSCGHEDLRFSVREIDGNKFYEIVCKKCGSKLQFGCNKTGDTLFPKRKVDGEVVGKFGWAKYNAETGKME